MAHSMSSIAQLTVVVAAILIFGGVDGKPPVRVVGGEDTADAELPYQVSLQMYGSHICGGTIISKRHILTAAHCIDPNDSIDDMTVRTGTTSKNRRSGRTNRVKSITTHPGYSGTYEDSWRNDISVITLAEDLDFDRFTQPARLPTEDTPSTLDCVASGWGALAYPSNIRPTYLKKATLTTLDNASCRQRLFDATISDGHLCAAASAGIGLCVGDSGGPLACNGEVVGIASFVNPCAQGDPDVFTRVYSYLDFINQVIASS